MAVSAIEIENAIAAHARWKVRLKAAIDSGKLDVPVEKIGVDDACDFGKWLHGLKDGSSQHLAVKALHAQFHRVAAEVASNAERGRKAEAEAMLSVSGPFTQASARLTAAMSAWKNGK